MRIEVDEMGTARTLVNGEIGMGVEIGVIDKTVRSCFRRVSSSLSLLPP
jgi:hypothetical protein